MAQQYAESQKQLTKESITESLFLLLKKKDYISITITDIARKAGVSRMAFYRNYHDKNQVIEEYFDHIYEEFFKETESMPVLTTETVSLKLVSYFDKHSDLFLESIEKGYNEILFRSFAKALGDFYNHTVTWDNYAGKRAHYWNTFMAAGLYYVFMDWIQHNKEETVEEIVQLVTEMNT